MSRRAIFWVSVNGNDVTSGLSPYVTSIRIRDAAGLASDTATIDVEDSYGQLQLPEAGAAISIGLGWVGGTPLVMFEGVVDDIGSTGGRGQGRMLSISAKSADTRGPLREKQEKHQDETSFGDVATEWGQAAGLSEVAVHPDLAAIERPWWGMQGESYLAWGARHARELDATFKVMGPRAVFVPRSQGQSAGGKPLQAIRAAWGENLISWSLKPVLGRPSYGKFRINWFDDKQAKWKSAQALYDLAEAEMLVGRRNDFYPLAIGLAGKVTYWLPAVVSLERRPTVLFVDPRATKKLTVSGRRFVLSAMHQRIRLEDPDFADVQLAIVQLDKLEGGDRVSRVYTDEGVDLYSFDELDGMVRETYDIWNAVLAERDEDTRRKAGGLRGTLV